MIDINLNNGEPTTHDDVQIIIQQIDMLFDTSKREVFGAEDYGARYEEFLHDLNISNEAVEYQVESDLSCLNLFGFVPSVTAYFLEGTLNDILMVKINLSKGNVNYEKTYTIK